MTPRWLSLSMAVALCLLVAPGCSSSTPSPEHPEGETEQVSSNEGDVSSQPPKEEASPKPMPTAPSGGADKGIPDDYTVMDGDCVQLGKHFGEVTRDDQLAQLDAKLSAKQREQAEGNIVGVAAKVGEQWTDFCLKSIAGKTQDPKALKCALDARTVKAFDLCINGESKDGK